MTRKFLGLGLVVLLAGVALAGAKSTKLTGYIIDNACSTRAAGENGAEKVKNHTVKCAQMPKCAESGYAVYSDGKLYKLDAAGNKQAADILKNTKAERGVQVSVEGDVDGDTIKVTKISEVGS
jgi:hypothetical protein